MCVQSYRQYATVRCAERVDVLRTCRTCFTRQTQTNTADLEGAARPVYIVDGSAGAEPDMSDPEPPLRIYKESGKWGVFADSCEWFELTQS